MNRLKYCPTQTGYSAKLGDGVISQKLDGGSSRYRRSLKNVPHTTNIQWVVGEAGYQYLMAFYRVWRRSPNQPFLAALIIDDSELKEYQCSFTESPTLSSKQGLVYTVSAGFEVKPALENTELDDLIVAVGNTSEDDDLWGFINPLETLVNESLPNALESLNV